MPSIAPEALLDVDTTLTEVLWPILRRAHAIIESGQARGKIVLEGF